MLIAALCLSACSSVNVTDPATTVCPPPAWPDEKVAEELQFLPYDGWEDFWTWMAKVEKLNEQLTTCRSP